MESSGQAGGDNEEEEEGGEEAAESKLFNNLNEEEEEEEDDGSIFVGKELDYQTCPNSPGKRKAKSDVWKHIKRLRCDHQKFGSHTHTCIVDGCGKFLKLLKPKEKTHYTTTKAFHHLKTEHRTLDLE